MKRNLLAILCLVCMLASLMAGCGAKESADTSDKGGAQTEATKDKPTYQLRISHIGAPDTWYDLIPREMVARMNEQAGYEAFKLEMYSSGQLANGDSENAELANTGTIEMTFTASDGIVNLNGALERWNIIAMPFILPNEDALNAFYDGEYGQALCKEATDATNVIVYPGWPTGGSILGSNKGEIRVPSDISGQKIRTTTSTLIMKSVEAWGATPVSVAWGETYTALQQGTVDGMINGLTSWYGGAFGEVCDYGTVLNSYINTNVPLVNKDFYNSLTPELQAIFDDGMEWLVQAFRDEYVKLAAEYLGEIEEAGMDIIELTDAEKEVWVEATAAMVEEYADIAGGMDYIKEVQAHVKTLG